MTFFLSLKKNTTFREFVKVWNVKYCGERNSVVQSVVNICTKLYGFMSGKKAHPLFIDVEHFESVAI